MVNYLPIPCREKLHPRFKLSQPWKIRAGLDEGRLILLPSPHRSQKIGFPGMNTSGEPSSPAASNEKKGPGRPRQIAAETQKQRVERLQDELRQAQAALKMSEEKKANIVGTAALRHARHHTEFARRLSVMLRAEIKAKSDRAIVADLLIEDTVPPQND
jgi:hypothetical protein